MRRIGSSLVSFAKGMSGPIASLAAAISDPLHWLKAAGVVTDDWQWTISPELRQTAFATVAVVWMFVWYHLQRTKIEDRERQLSVAPHQRRLSERDKNILRDAAAALPPQTEDSFDIIAETSSQEAHMLAAQISRAFNEGGWSTGVQNVVFSGPSFKTGMTLMLPDDADANTKNLVDAVAVALGNVKLKFARETVKIGRPRIYVHFHENTEF